jgi:hypothetical protein
MRMSDYRAECDHEIQDQIVFKSLSVVGANLRVRRAAVIGESDQRANIVFEDR